MTRRLNWRSCELTSGKRIASEAFLSGLPLSRDQFNQAQIGVGTPWLHGNLCNTHTPKLAAAIQEGCNRAGVVGMPFGLPGVSDALSMGHPGMRYSLVSRGIIADAIEMVVEAHLYDAFVGIHACDKNGPGAVIAMARLNIPSLLLSGGTILPGCLDGKEINIKDAFDAAARHRVGQATLEEKESYIRHACPGPGGCGAMYTFNTMGVVFEAMGLTLPYSSSTPAVDDKKIDECRRIGLAIKHLLEEDIRPKQILTPASFRNGIAAAAAIGGSTNVVLHLLAIANEAGIPLALEDFQEIFRSTPVIADFAPRGTKTMNDLHKAGGTPALLKVLLADGIIDGEILTVTGRSLKENIEPLPELTKGQTVVCPKGTTLKETADLQILFGSLAPDGVVFKVPYNIDRFTGPAKVFNGEATMVAAVAKGEIKPGDVVVIRYVGPKGAPGMPEMLEPTSALSGVPELKGKVALVTDARFSGVSTGFIGGHVSPEAYDGGPIALVQNGDPIVIDLRGGTIDIDVPEETLAKRKAVIPDDPFPMPALMRSYRQRVGSARNGCLVD